MELKEFITNTLVEIATGVNDAKSAYLELNGEVNPDEQFQIGDRSKPACNIDFEVALSENTATKGNKGIGVALSFVSADGSKSTENEINSLTKIKFTVPVILP